MVVVVDVRKGEDEGYFKVFSLFSTITGFPPGQWWLFLFCCRGSRSSGCSSDWGEGAVWQMEGHVSEAGEGGEH